MSDLARQFNSVEDVLAHLAECLLATVEGLPKRASKYERRRHGSIAETAVGACVKFNVRPDRGCPRLTERLAAKPLKP